MFAVKIDYVGLHADTERLKAESMARISLLGDMSAEQKQKISSLSERYYNHLWTSNNFLMNIPEEYRLKQMRILALERASVEVVRHNSDVPYAVNHADLRFVFPNEANKIASLIAHEVSAAAMADYILTPAGALFSGDKHAALRMSTTIKLKSIIQDHAFKLIMDGKSEAVIRAESKDFADSKVQAEMTKIRDTWKEHDEKMRESRKRLEEEEEKVKKKPSVFVQPVVQDGPFDPLKEVGYGTKEKEVSVLIQKKYLELMDIAIRLDKTYVFGLPEKEKKDYAKDKKIDEYEVQSHRYNALVVQKSKEAEAFANGEPMVQGFEFAKTQDLGQLDAWLAANPHESEFRKSVEYVHSVKQARDAKAWAETQPAPILHAWLLANPGESAFRSAVSFVHQSKHPMP